jgi:hypothetical protein
VKGVVNGVFDHISSVVVIGPAYGSVKRGTLHDTGDIGVRLKQHLADVMCAFLSLAFTLLRRS